MAVTETTDSFLFFQVAANERVILEYQTDECGADCINFKPIYKKLSEKPQYEKIVFLVINADSNPMAMKRILDKSLPVITIYFKGKLLDSRHAYNEETITALLDKLLAKV